MKDFKTIVTEFRKLDFTNRKAALATVVKVRGSSYRSPGARMLITDDGKWVGSISGGCLEGDALRKARQVMMDRKPMMVTYDTREESNQNLGIGLGCNGVIDVLIEPILLENKDNPVSLFESFIATREPLAIATIFSATEGVGEKIILHANGEVQDGCSNVQLSNIVKQQLAEVFETKKSEAKTFSSQKGPIEVFVELVQPTVSLIIFG